MCIRDRAYFAKRNPHLASFLTEGRSFGPHGTGLFIANSLEHYDEALSQELTHLTVTANKMCIRDRDESFQVILAKLDDVDGKKRRRYELVYGKLHDFEDYMRRLGVDVDLTGQLQPPAPVKDPALMNPEETLESLILLSVEHNLKLMHLLSNEQKLDVYKRQPCAGLFMTTAGEGRSAVYRAG